MSIHRSFDRYLIKDVCKNYSIIQGLEFTSSRETLKAKCKYLKFFGKGNKPEACESLSESEIEQLWTSKCSWRSFSPKPKLHNMVPHVSPYGHERER